MNTQTKGVRQGVDTRYEGNTVLDQDCGPSKMQNMTSKPNQYQMFQKKGQETYSPKMKRPAQRLMD